ncbi:4-hydroxythreonine-4-phosphate dehydrogenase PdxA [Xylophilus rhododendri]|uniref:4-hydroxythreonine-4-phosphate dehydrogenase PdxA n=1 Tax=Xylophilus rhododendri TaxID=2697032 RepID=A0A857J3D5_9BURK|nr:4-hydroxythreonine-4-phosphate dehydrogenase PdxA [Xylophilus rhododendri]QHI98177.1 4-hydroxythreonine-4-phosphate dehydrogenase PdxA [Xylophilus rhododendri]
MKSAHPLPIAVTAGDPAGIGPEIVARLFRDHAEEMRGCFAVGDPDVLRRAAACWGTPGLPVALLESAAEAWDVPPRCLPVLPVVRAQGPVAWGEISAEAGRQAAEAVTWAARAALRGEIAALVTAPLHKEALSAAGVDFPGHTELLQAEAAAHLGRGIAEVPVRMMLANEELRTVLVSIHMSLRRALDAVDFDNVLQTLRISHASLSRMLGRPARLAVAGLNPHAGEGGLFGREEIDTIAPAIAAAKAEGIQASGPYPPDTIFMRARAQHGQPGGFDAVVAMYHDQGLIPVKYLGIEQGVNVTLGLPLVRTSPDHGTAFDLAGSGRADASSLLAAVRLARLLAA